MTLLYMHVHNVHLHVIKKPLIPREWLPKYYIIHVVVAN